MSIDLAMGGYGAFVWPAWGAALLILGGFTVAAVTRYRRAVRALARLEDGR